MSYGPLTGFSPSRSLGMSKQALQAYNELFNTHSENFANLGTIAGKEKESFLSTYHSIHPYEGPCIVEPHHTYRIDRCGTPIASSTGTHLAIEGKGFFPVLSSNDPRGYDDNREHHIAYTRVGTFELDKHHNFVNHLGHRLLVEPTGFASASNGTGAERADLVPLDTSNAFCPAQATQALTFKMQLPSNYHGSPLMQPLNIHNDKGELINLVCEWTPLPNVSGNLNSNWRLQIKPDPANPSYAPSGAYSQGVTLSFDGQGNFLGIQGSPAPLSVEGMSKSIDMNFGSIGKRNGIAVSGTQLSGRIMDDGYAPGELRCLNFTPDGKGIATYTNGQEREYCRLVLGVFANPNHLRSVENGLYLPNNRYGGYDDSFGSGYAHFHYPEEHNAGKIKASAYEGSNVNATKVYVDMIKNEREYANNLSALRTMKKVSEDTNALI